MHAWDASMNLFRYGKRGAFERQSIFTWFDCHCADRNPISRSQFYRHKKTNNKSIHFCRKNMLFVWLTTMSITMSKARFLWAFYVIVSFGWQTIYQRNVFHVGFYACVALVLSFSKCANRWKIVFATGTWLCLGSKKNQDSFRLGSGFGSFGIVRDRNWGNSKIPLLAHTLAYIWNVSNRFGIRNKKIKPHGHTHTFIMNASAATVT